VRGVPCAGSREAHTFLNKLGVGGRLQQSLVARYGGATEAHLREDPYSALFPIGGLSFRRAPLLPPAAHTPRIAACIPLHCSPTLEQVRKASVGRYCRPPQSFFTVYRSLREILTLQRSPQSWF
jgi:hypothetical protein